LRDEGRDCLRQKMPPTDHHRGPVAKQKNNIDCMRPPQLVE
jgi:hypothetical protein